MQRKHWIATGLAVFFIALVGGGYYLSKSAKEAQTELAAAKAQADKSATAVVREIAGKLDKLDKLDKLNATAAKNGLRAACNQEWVEVSGQKDADHMRASNRENRVLYTKLEGEMRDADVLARALSPAPAVFPKLERIEDGALFGVKWTEKEPGPSFNEMDDTCLVREKSGSHHERKFAFTADWRQVATFAAIRAKEVARDNVEAVDECDDDECKRDKIASNAERFALDFLARGLVFDEKGDEIGIVPFLKGEFTEEVRKMALPVLNDPARLTSATSWIIPLVERFAPKKTMEPFHGWLSLLWKGSRVNLNNVAEAVKTNGYATNDLTRWNAFFLRRWNAAEKSEGSGKALITTWQTQIVRIGRAIDHPDVALWAKTLRQEWEKSHPTGHGALLASIAP